jgi:uncharacterized protein YaiE (UPF0345 family)/predicted GNAT family N-acyltransferase
MIDQHLAELATDGAASPDVYFLTAQKPDHGIVGISAIAKYHWTGQNLVTGIFVSPRFQGQGIGTVLLYKSLEFLKVKFEMSIAKLYTTAGSPGDQNLYRKFGATRIENVTYPGVSVVAGQVTHSSRYLGKWQDLLVKTNSCLASLGVMQLGTYIMRAERDEDYKVLIGSLEIEVGEKRIKLHENDMFSIAAGDSIVVTCHSEIAYLSYRN